LLKRPPLAPVAVDPAGLLKVEGPMDAEDLCRVKGGLAPPELGFPNMPPVEAPVFPKRPPPVAGLDEKMDILSILNGRL
jgi:hypothetical protein